MSWQPRFHRLRHPRKRPRAKEPRLLFHASRWANLPDIFLGLAILKLGTEERLAVGPARARYRAKRLRAVELYRRRFSRVPKLVEYSMRQLPRLGQ
jgi:hypothetical protein